MLLRTSRHLRHSPRSWRVWRHCSTRQEGTGKTSISGNTAYHITATPCSECGRRLHAHIGWRSYSFGQAKKNGSRIPNPIEFTQRSHRRKRMSFDVSQRPDSLRYQFENDEDTSSKSCSRQNGANKLKNLWVWSESTSRIVDGLVPFEALRVGRVLAKVQRTSRASRRRCQRRRTMPEQGIIPNDSERCSRHWNPVYLKKVEKQTTQWRLSHKSTWRMLPDC